MTRKTYTIAEAAEMLGIGLTSAYEAAHNGQLPVIRFGRRLIIPAQRFDQMLAWGAAVKPSVDPVDASPTSQPSGEPPHPSRHPIKGHKPC